LKKNIFSWMNDWTWMSGEWQKQQSKTICQNKWNVKKGKSNFFFLSKLFWWIHLTMLKEISHKPEGKEEDFFVTVAGAVDFYFSTKKKSNLWMIALIWLLRYSQTISFFFCSCHAMPCSLLLCTYFSDT